MFLTLCTVFLRPDLSWTQVRRIIVCIILWVLSDPRSVGRLGDDLFTVVLRALGTLWRPSLLSSLRAVIPTITDRDRSMVLDACLVEGVVVHGMDLKMACSMLRKWPMMLSDEPTIVISAGLIDRYATTSAISGRKKSCYHLPKPYFYIGTIWQVSRCFNDMFADREEPIPNYTKMAFRLHLEGIRWHRFSSCLPQFDKLRIDW